MANDKLTILCSVAADFEAPGGLKYSITRNDLNLILEAPAWIENTLMFRWLCADGSLKAVTSANRVQAENAPTVGIGADGKAVLPEAKQEPAKTARKGRQKASAKKDESQAAEEAGQAAEPKIEGKDAE